MPALRVVPLSGLPVARLERLARRVFGDGDRPPGWLARKLAREAVDPRLSALALVDEFDGPIEHAPEDSLVGYLLVGREPGDPVAHSAGLGLVPEARGRGHGGALLAAVAGALRREGSAALRVLAEPDREGWYARQGLRVRSRHVTMLAFGTGSSSPVPGDMLPWSPDPTAVELCAWRPGTWERTPALDAATVDLGGGALAHVSREGTALLVHRLATPPGADPCAAVTALLARIDRGAPVLLYGCDAVSSITASSGRLGLTTAQRFAVMDLPLGRELYIPRDAEA